MTKKVGALQRGPAASADEAPPGQAGGVSLSSLGVSDGIGPTELPRLQPRTPALFMVHPERWHVCDGAVVPLCGRFPISGGIAGVRMDRRSKALNVSHAFADKERKGWQILPLEVDGPGTSYLHQPIPGTYLTRWEQAYAGSSIVTHDTAGFVRWLTSLIERGVIQPPKSYVLERMAGRLRQEILALQDKVRTVPSAQVDLDRKVADLAVVQATIGNKPLTPAPSKPASLGELVE